MKVPHVTVIPLSRGYYASLTSEAERRIDQASQEVDAATEREAVNALAIELITIGGEILNSLHAPATDLESAIDRLIKASDRRAAKQIDAAATGSSIDYKRRLDGVRAATPASATRWPTRPPPRP